MQVIEFQILKIIFTGKPDFTFNRTSVLLKGLNNLRSIELSIIPVKSDKIDYQTIAEKAFQKIFHEFHEIKIAETFVKILQNYLEKSFTNQI